MRRLLLVGLLLFPCCRPCTRPIRRSCGSGADRQEPGHGHQAEDHRQGEGDGERRHARRRPDRERRHRDGHGQRRQCRPPRRTRCPPARAPSSGKPFWTRRCEQGLQVQRLEGRERPRQERADQEQGRRLPDQGHDRRQARAGRRRAAGSRLGRLRALRDRRRRLVQRAVRERPGHEQGPRPSSRSRSRPAKGRASRPTTTSTTTTTSTSTTTTTLPRFPFMTPPGRRAAALPRPGVRGRDHDRRHRLRQRGQHLGPDDHAAASTSTSRPATR